MLAYAMHLLRTESAQHVRVHPDGEHGKQFDFKDWLQRQGFRKKSRIGKTVYGSIINTRHSGQKSRLYKGLCETVGMLMANPAGGRQIAVVPYTETSLRLAQRLIPRCAQADIEIALIKGDGQVVDIRP